MACQNKNSEQHSLQREVIDVHDEIMPLMGEFTQNSIKIDTLLNNLAAFKAEHPEVDTAAARTELHELQVTLDQARESMNDWMHAFQLEHPEKNHEEIMAYYSKEMEKINQVKADFKEAEEKSKSVLTKYFK